MTFLPEGYKEPTTENYMKFQDGENHFRILSSAIVGTEFWKEETNDKGEKVRKPVRRRLDEAITPDEIGVDKYGEPEKMKHFWAFVVYNRDAKRIQILEITQKTIQRAIKSLVNSKKWGDPQNYDIMVERSGEGLETDYVTQGEPPLEPTEKDIVKGYKAMNINLEALFDGDDPFKVQNEIEDRNDDSAKDEIDPNDPEFDNL